MPKSSIFLGNFCKGVKIFNFSSEILFGQLFTGHTNFFPLSFSFFYFFETGIRTKLKRSDFVYSFPLAQFREKAIELFLRNAIKEFGQKFQNCSYSY